MLSTTINTINTTMLYADYTERTYKIPVTGDISEVGPQIKPRIQAFNQAAADNTSSVAQTFLSDNGAAITSIKEAKVIQRTEEIIYAN